MTNKYDIITDQVKKIWGSTCFSYFPMTKISLAPRGMREWKSGVSPDIHSRTSLVAGENFVKKNQKNKSYPKFLQLISEMVVTDYHLPKQVSSKGS